MADSDIAPAAPGDGGGEGAVEPMDTSGENEKPQAEDGAAALGLNELLTILTPVAPKWYPLGVQFKLSTFDLHEIEKEFQGQSKPAEQLEQMAKLLVERSEPKPTWRMVVDGLRGIQENSLAQEVETKFCPSSEEGEGKGAENGEGSTSVEVPDYKTQQQEIHAVLHQRLKKGDTWYLVDVRWMKQWKKYVGYDQWDQSNAGQDTTNPGPIDNSNLFKNAQSDILKDHLMEELDYSLMPEAAWSKLHAWYGLSEGSRPIARNVVEHGLYMKHCKVEVYLLEFKLAMHPKTNETVTKMFSRADTVGVVEKQLRQTFQVPEETECRVWHRYMTSTYELLSNHDSSLQDVGLYSGQIIVLEKKNDDGSWPRTIEPNGRRSTDSITGASGSSGKSYSGGASSSWGSQKSYYSSWYNQPTNPGLCGLSNLGNTCFMNSALQCLSNTEPLTEYFVGIKDNEKPYKKHINKVNPLGMGGAIAESYGALLEEMWSGNCSCVAPRHFKTQVARYAPQFVGYAQHDSQELLAFLLDGLHEDLNLVKKKPYVDMTIKTENRHDSEIAEEAWHKYLLRNQSVIVKVFQGQLKSTLVCPKCSKVSKIFDPFMFLSLPLPVKKTRSLTVSLARADPTLPLCKYKLQVPKRGQIVLLKEELSKLSGVIPALMVVMDVYNGRFHRIYSPNESLTHIMDRDEIIVYELSCPLNDKDWVHVPVYHREEVVREVRYTYQPYTQRYHHLFGLPVVVPVPRQNCTYRNLYDAVMKTCGRYVTRWSEAKLEERKKSNEREDAGSEDESMETNDEGNAANNADSEGNVSNKPDNEGGSPVDPQTETDTVEDKDKDKGEGQVDEGEEPEAEVKGKEKGEEEQESEMDLFQLVVVNSYGSQEVQKLKDNDKPLRLTSQTYVACDWTLEMKDRCYDVEKAEEVTEHDSCNEVVQQKKNVHILDCLKLFTFKETLSPDDAWYCPDCKDFVQASKKFDLWKLPEILVIHLKRFSYDRYYRDKLDIKVDYPVSGLDLTEFVESPDGEEPIYNLFAVSNHYGGLGGGHYTAYCKNKDTGKWHNFDDSHVSEASEQQVVTSAAYVLFYRRSNGGGPRVRILDRSLSQSFAEEVERRGAKFQPKQESMEEEEEKEEGDRREGVHNHTDDVFHDSTATTSLEEPD